MSNPTASTPVDAPPTAQAQVSATGWWTVAIVTIATFMLMLDLTVVNVALPEMRASLHANFSGLQWVIDAYALTLAAFLLTAGSLADRLGRRRVFAVGFLVFSLASLACGLAGGIVTLAAARAVQGTGAAILFAVGPTLIGQEFHGKARGAAFGVFGAGAGLAIAAGPLIGGALTSDLNWRWIFLVNVPIGLIATLLSRWRMRESVNSLTQTLDWAGLFTFTAGLAAVVLALLRGTDQGWTSAPILALLVTGVVLLTAFAVIEKLLGARAMLETSLFRIRSFTALSIVATLVSAGAMSAIFFLVSYTENILGYSPWQAGLRFMPMTGALFVTAAIGGGLIAKVPQRILLGVSCAFIAVGLSLAAPLLHANSQWTAVLPSTVLLGVGMGLFNPVRAYLAIGVAEPAKAGSASGMNETFQQVGMVLGIAAFGDFFENRVTDAFASSTPGKQLGTAARPLGKQIATGAVGQAQSPTASVIEAVRSSFVTGLHDVLPWCAAVAALAAVISFAFIRRADLHPAAIGALPGVPPEIADPI